MKQLARNKRGHFNYIIEDKFEAGISLQGGEVKSIKKGQISLKEAYIRISPNLEAFLINAHVSPYQKRADYEPTRSRKLLLHKSELIKLNTLVNQKKLTAIPLSAYLKKGLIKIQIGVGRAKKKQDKREKIKREIDKKESANW